MQPGRRIVLHGDLHGLVLIILGALGRLNGIFTLTDSQGDQLFSNAAHFLGAGIGGDNLALIQQLGHLPAEKRNTLIGRPAQLTIL